MKITRQTLTDLGACGEGIEAFCSFYPEGLDLGEWTKEEQIRVLRSPLSEYLGWAWSRGLAPMWSLRGANLRRANLRGADLEGANLRGADLDRAVGLDKGTQ